MKKIIYLLFMVMSILFFVIGWIAHFFKGSVDVKFYILAFICFLVYTIIALYQLLEDKEKSSFIKLLWIIGFVLLNFLTGILYYWVELREKEQK